MDNNLFTGKQVRLIGDNPESDPALLAQWARDSEFLMLWDSDPARPRTSKQYRELMERHGTDSRPGVYSFMIQRLDDDERIGLIALWGANGQNRDAWVSIAIGKREDWGKGYGSDAMNVLLKFAFRELNLHRLTLLTFSYNERAIRSYARVGFVEEGRVRGALLRDAARYDFIFMGVLRQAWEKRPDIDR